MTASVFVQACRGITWREVLVTFLLGCALYMYHAGVGFIIDLDSPSVDLQTFFIFVADQLKVFPMLPAMAVANQWTANDRSRRGVYTLAVLIAAVPAATLAVTWMSDMTRIFMRPASVRFGFVAFVYFDVVMIGAAVIWVINDRQRARRAREQMDRAERERIEAERRSIESDLQAMQARVEPQFLFNSLAQVRELYDSDVAQGEQMLDELIAYLHAAMPRMRDTSSTVAQELELARAYLNVVRLRIGERFTFQVAMDRAIGAIRMPPMLLLPLLDYALARRGNDVLDQRKIGVAASVSDGALHIKVADSAGAFTLRDADHALADVRERLQALFGARGCLAARSFAEGGAEAVLEMPSEEKGNR